MNLRHTSTVLSLCALLALGACGGDESATSESSSAATPAAATSGSGDDTGTSSAAPADTSGRKKASSAKLPAKLMGFEATPKDEGQIAMGMYSSTSGTPRMYTANIRRMVTGGEDAVMKDPKVYGDVSCGMMAAGVDAPVCIAKLDGGLLMITGSSQEEKPAEMAKFAQALYDSFA